MHIFEDPSGLKFNTWSPFESREYFIHQLKVMKENINSILDHFIRRSPFFTYPFVAGTLVIILIALILSSWNEQRRYLYVWIITTFIIYCSGFILIIARSPRRFYALMIIFLLLAIHSLEELSKGMSGIVSGRRKKVLIFSLIFVVVSAFSLKPGTRLFRATGTVMAGAQLNPYGEIAEKLNAYQFPSPYAIIRSSQKHHTDYYIAYFLRKQFLGRPLSDDIHGITEELRAANAKSLLVFDNPGIVMKLNEDERYVHAGSLKLKNYDKQVNPINAVVDQITNWDDEVNIYVLR
jgi:hypothetical protein